MCGWGWWWRCVWEWWWRCVFFLSRVRFFIVPTVFFYIVPNVCFFCPVSVFFVPTAFFLFCPSRVCLFCPVFVFFVPVRFFCPATVALGALTACPTQLAGQRFGDQPAKRGPRRDAAHSSILFLGSCHRSSTKALADSGICALAMSWAAKNRSCGHVVQTNFQHFLCAPTWPWSKPRRCTGQTLAEQSGIENESLPWHKIENFNGNFPDHLLRSPSLQLPQSLIGLRCKNRPCQLLSGP